MSMVYVAGCGERNGLRRTQRASEVALSFRSFNKGTLRFAPLKKSLWTEKQKRPHSFFPILG